jgi:hypothetical protein
VTCEKPGNAEQQTSNSTIRQEKVFKDFIFRMMVIKYSEITV